MKMKTIQYYCWLLSLVGMLGSCSGGDDVTEAPEPDIPTETPAEPESSGDEPVLLLPCDGQATMNTQKLYGFLHAVYGKKCLSASMASVNWNTVEADFVFRLTGKYPAIHCFDFIHLPYSPSDWIDYSNLTPVYQWAEAGGLVALMWHCLVPEAQGSENYTYHPEETTFSAGRALQDGTWEHAYWQDQLDKLCAVLLALQEVGIPTLWRPFHEAAGNVPTGGKAWFWWGNEGSVTYVELWKYTFEYLQRKGVHNLIWVWTTENNGDADWYPGDAYVDIIGRDLYGQTATAAANEWTAIQQQYAGKMVALTECGNALDGRTVRSAQATIGEQWSSKGARWLYFMPWYDYDYDNGKAQENVMCSDSFWQNALSRSYVLTRDDVKSIY